MNHPAGRFCCSPWDLPRQDCGEVEIQASGGRARRLNPVVPKLLYGWIPVPRAYRDPLTSLRSAGLVKALRTSFAAAQLREPGRDVALILDWRRVNQPEAVRVFGRRVAARHRVRSVAGRRAGDL